MRSKGYRSGTRHRYSQAFRKSGMPNPSVVLRTFKKNQMVDIVVDPSIHKGMPYKFYHGRTGRVYDVNKRAVTILMNRQFGPKKIERKITARIEHVKPSRCNEEFIKRRTENEIKRKEATEKGEKIVLKRIPAGPRQGMVVDLKENVPVELKNEAYYEVY